MDATDKRDFPLSALKNTLLFRLADRITIKRNRFKKKKLEPKKTKTRKKKKKRKTDIGRWRGMPISWVFSEILEPIESAGRVCTKLTKKRKKNLRAPSCRRGKYLKRRKTKKKGEEKR